jgi:hypothetical protein
MTPTASLFPAGEPEVYGEHRGEALDRPFRRCEVQVYGARRFGAVAYRFSGVLYAVELPRAFPPLHLAPRARWPFLLALLGLSGILLALLARHLAGHPVLKPGTSPLLLLAFPAFYLYLFAAWKVATEGIGPRWPWKENWPGACGPGGLGSPSARTPPWARPSWRHGRSSVPSGSGWRVRGFTWLFLRSSSPERRRGSGGSWGPRGAAVGSGRTSS